MGVKFPGKKRYLTLEWPPITVYLSVSTFSFILLLFLFNVRPLMSTFIVHFHCVRLLLSAFGVHPHIHYANVYIWCPHSCVIVSANIWCPLLLILSILTLSFILLVSLPSVHCQFDHSMMLPLTWVRGFAKKKKSEITMEVGGWVQVSLGIFFVLENLPQIALNQC